MSRACSKCKVIKLIEDYPATGQICSECKKAYRQEYYAKNKEKLKEQTKTYRKLVKEKADTILVEEKECPESVEEKADTILVEEKKVCTRCDADKVFSEYRLGRNICKECEKSYGREYGNTHRDKRKQWVDNNKEKMTGLQSKWRKKNIEKINNTYNDRYATDPKFKITRGHKQALWKVIKMDKPHKKYIDVEYKLIKKWFLFLEPTFTVEQYGTIWCIDHTVPLDSWEFEIFPEDEFIFFDWRNTRPTTRDKNRAKSNKLDIDLICEHKQKLISFYEINNLNIEELKLYFKRLHEIIVAATISTTVTELTKRLQDSL